jgi:hypothetical protein
MKKLILRLLAVILSVYLAGSIYPLFATEGGHSHGPAPSTPPPPPPPPTAPSAPPMLDTKGPQLPPPPPREVGGGGCGPELTGPVIEAQGETESWRHTDFNDTADRKIEQVKNNADYLLEDIRRDIKRAQDRWHQADVEVNTYQNKKNRGTLANPELLQMAQDERQKSFQELERQKGRLEKVEAWRSRTTREIWSFRDRGKNGDYQGYRGLRDYDTSFHPSWFK